MTDKDRNRIRAKQDQLIELALAKDIDFQLQITSSYAGAPRIADLTTAIYPEWESSIDYAISFLKENKQ